jgi:phage shock protein PspC (stress-responsive transcriptional regulator)
VALVGALDALHTTTREGIAAGERRDRVIVRLTWVLIVASVLLVVLTGAIVYLTWVLVLHEAG